VDRGLLVSRWRPLHLARRSLARQPYVGSYWVAPRYDEGRYYPGYWGYQGAYRDRDRDEDEYWEHRGWHGDRDDDERWEHREREWDHDGRWRAYR